MDDIDLPMRPHRIGRWYVLLFLLSLGVPPLLYAHIRLEASTPARDDILTMAPAQLRLRFSERIERRYTTVTLTAPDGTPVPLGAVTFLDGSDREMVAWLPPLPQSGRYAVGWRTAGADGHVLEGSYSFTLALDSAGTAPAAAVPPVPDDAPDDHGGHEELRAEGRGGAFGRGLHFLALLLVLGAIGFRVLVLPRLAVMAQTRKVLQARAWRTLAVAALLFAAAAVLRLWLQSVALHGAERAWSTPLLTMMLRDTSWGRTWLLQAFLFAVLGMAIAWAHPGRDRVAAVLAVAAAAGLAAMPALSGHAAGATGLGWLAVVNDALHVTAVGAWLGTLAVLMVAAMPALRRLEPAGADAAAHAIAVFSPIALAGATIVIATGVINTLMHLSAPAQLWTTTYGRTLAVKLVMVFGVVAMGFINWRIVTPRLREADAAWRLRFSAAAELLFALLVLAATAVLTGQPRP